MTDYQNTFSLLLDELQKPDTSIGEYIVNLRASISDFEKTEPSKPPKLRIFLESAEVLLCQIETAKSLFSRTLLPHIDSVEVSVNTMVRTALRESISGIYTIIDPQAVNNKNLVEVAKSAINGGVRIVQYRDKVNDRSVFLENAQSIQEICDEAEVPFVVNDAADIANLVGSPFLHVGQSDLPVKSASTILGRARGIGRSNNGPIEASESEYSGVDYLAIGAVYATSTMGKSSRTPVGPEVVERLVQSTELPVVAIGGIGAENLDEVRRTGVQSVCIVSAITMAESPERSARSLVDAWNSGS
ncbi:MAG: thiamine phosphate synthase [SAR202 cluster bacterium]|nr:thiamine phosphate synthase [SAR202 cluster bacterium]